MWVKSRAELFTMPCFGWMRWDFILILKVFHPSPLSCLVGLSWGTMKRRRWRKDVAKCRILRHSAINHSGGSTMLCIVLWNRLMKYTGDQLLHTRLASVLLWSCSCGLHISLHQYIHKNKYRNLKRRNIQYRSETNNLKSMADAYTCLIPTFPKLHKLFSRSCQHCHLLSLQLLPNLYYTSTSPTWLP